MSNKIITTSTLDRFKDNLADVAVTGDYDDISNIPMWRGTRAEHDAEVKSGTLPNNIIVGITDEQGGSDDPDDPTSLSSIQVYSSADQEPLAYESDGTTYYLPRVTFDGSAKGKILGIRFVDADGKMRSMEYDKLWHMGVNVFVPERVERTYISGYYSYSYPFSKGTTNGVTVTYLGKGKYQVQGTCTASEGTISCFSPCIGYVSENVIANLIPSPSANLYIKPSHVQGEYGGIKICCSSDYSSTQSIYDAGCRLDETKVATLVKQDNKNIDIYPFFLLFIGGETYDCTFYVQVTPMLDDGKIGSLQSYESPFNTNQFTVFKAGLYYVKDQATSSTASINNYICTTAGNTSNYGVINYPIVHSGKNTFIYGVTFTDSASLPTIEVYYIPDYDKYRDIDNLNEVDFSISNGHFNRFAIFGGAGQDTTNNIIIYSGVKLLWYNNLYLPKGIWEWRFKITNSVKYAYGHYAPSANYQNPNGIAGNYSRAHEYDSVSLDYFDQGYNISRYIPNTEFQYNVKSSGTRINTSYDITTYIEKNNISYTHCIIVPDYDGWDDSVSEND